MRYLPLTDDDRAAMLSAIGAESVDELFRDVPAAAASPAFDLPGGAGEIEVERALEALAARNTAAGSAPFFLGAGRYRHHVPATVDALVQRGEFLTSYTPYQPEISQGTLQSLFEFQTQTALLTGLDVANASMYDGATACLEAARMAVRAARRPRVVLSGALHPHYRAVCETGFAFEDVEVDSRPVDYDGGEDLEAALDDRAACVVVQYPDFFGRLRDLSGLAASCRRAGALLVVAVTEVVALGLLRSPGEMGADIAAAEGGSLGNRLDFGGPSVGLFACRERHLRQMPGRLVGEARDADGRRGWVLTLSAREQHIRREKATSNICTSAGLCALAFSIHLALLGGEGLARLARLNHARAARLADRLDGLPGVEILNREFFNEFTVRLDRPAAPVVEALARRGVLGGVPVSRLLPGEADAAPLLLAVATETNTEADIEAFAAALSEVLR